MALVRVGEHVLDVPQDEEGRPVYNSIPPNWWVQGEDGVWVQGTNDQGHFWTPYGWMDTGGYVVDDTGAPNPGRVGERPYWLMDDPLAEGIVKAWKPRPKVRDYSSQDKKYRARLINQYDETNRYKRSRYWLSAPGPANGFEWVELTTGVAGSVVGVKMESAVVGNMKCYVAVKAGGAWLENGRINGFPYVFELSVAGANVAPPPPLNIHSGIVGISVLHGYLRQFGADDLTINHFVNGIRPGDFQEFEAAWYDFFEQQLGGGHVITEVNFQGEIEKAVAGNARAKNATAVRLIFTNLSRDIFPPMPPIMNGDLGGLVTWLSQEAKLSDDEIWSLAQQVEPGDWDRWFELYNDYYFKATEHGGGGCRAGLRRVEFVKGEVQGRGERPPPSEEDDWQPPTGGGGFSPINIVKVFKRGNFSDYADIVKLLVKWAGFTLYPECVVYGNVETTGIKLDPPGCLPERMFDKRPVIDAVKELAEIVGYIVFIDSDGAFRFESPNWFALGNQLTNGLRTDFVPELDERVQVTQYTAALSDKNLRSEIIISSADPYKLSQKDTVVTRTIPNGVNLLKGQIRPAMWINEKFTNPKESAELGRLVALHAYWSQRKGNVDIVGNPALEPNDQVRIVEKVTGESYVHYVRSISSTMDLDSGTWRMSLTTNWLGDEWSIESATGKYFGGTGQSSTGLDGGNGLEGSI